MKIQVLVDRTPGEQGTCTLTILNERGMPIGRGPVTHAVEITATPPGEAPQWVRDAWVGLVFPTVDPRLTNYRDRPPVGVLSGRPTEGGGYTVPALVALELLRLKSPSACDWWQQNVPALLSAEAGLCFDYSACEVVAEGEGLFVALQGMFSTASALH